MSLQGFDVSCLLKDYDIDDLNDFPLDAEPSSIDMLDSKFLDRQKYGKYNDGYDHDFTSGMGELSLEELSAMAMESIGDEVSELDLTAEELEWLKKPEEEIKNRILELAEEIERETELAAMRSRPDLTVSNVNHQVKCYTDEEVRGISSGSCDFSVAQNDCRKRRLCRHFLKGHCKRGNSCDFLHDTSIFCPDSQKVFLGGLPAHITAEQLVEKLGESGYQVINKPKVLRGFTPQVCLASEEQAKALIAAQQVFINGCPVDVRPYEDRKPPDDLKRSVFLGGLPSGAMVHHIKNDLTLFGVRVCNHPILKAGFVPQVVLGSPEEAQRLINAKKVSIAGKMVEVRPYVNFRKRY